MWKVEGADIGKCTFQDWKESNKDRLKTPKAPNFCGRELWPRQSRFTSFHCDLTINAWEFVWRYLIPTRFHKPWSVWAFTVLLRMHHWHDMLSKRKDETKRISFTILFWLRTWSVFQIELIDWSDWSIDVLYPQHCTLTYWHSWVDNKNLSLSFWIFSIYQSCDCHQVGRILTGGTPKKAVTIVLGPGIVAVWIGQGWQWK